MKRKQINNLTPKVGIAIVVAALIVLVLIGVYRDGAGEICSGFMGTKASCVEETALCPYGLIGFALILFFCAWWVMNYMDKAIEPKKPKPKK